MGAVALITSVLARIGLSGPAPVPRCTVKRGTGSREVGAGMTRARLACVALAVATAWSLIGLGGVAEADTIYVEGDRTGQTATVICEFNSQTNTLTFTVSNTSVDAVVTGVGFDLIAGDFTSKKSSGINGFSGMQAQSLTSEFTFSDGVLGAVPSSRSTVLDFGFLTGTTFRRGSAVRGVDPGDAASFTVSAVAFAGLNEAQICNAVFVRFV